MSASDPLLQFAAAVLVLAAPAGVLTALPTGRARALRAVVGAGLVGAIASLVVDAVAGDAAAGLSADLPARILDAAIAAAVTAIVARLAAERLGAAGALTVAASWSVLVYQPVIAAVVGEFPPLVQSLTGAVDFAGVLATHVAAAATLIAVHVLPWPRRPAAPAPSGGGLMRSLAGAALIVLGALAWFAGVERVIDAATGRILVNGLVGVVLATVAWAAVEKIRWNRFTPAGLVGGALSGWAAVGLGAPFLEPPALVATAVLGGAVASAMSGGGEGRRAAPGLGWSLGAIGAAATGGIVLALLGDGFGLASTGTLLLVAGQLAAVLVVALIAGLAGLVCAGLAIAVDAVRGRLRANRTGAAHPDDAA